MRRTKPLPGQESVWDYPRPPRVEPVSRRVEVHFAGRRIADTHNAVRVLETSHPPVYYLPREDVDAACLVPTDRGSFCEFKGHARYFDVRIGERVAPAACWSYPEPGPGFEVLRDRLAFYADRVDACFVGGERVTPQPGSFYGGWITGEVVGPFKGGPGSRGW